MWVQIPAGPAKGLWFKVDPYREEGYSKGCPEPGVQEEFLKNLNPGDCLYDVGAHIGFYSLIASRVVGEEGCVVAFEPDPDNVTLLQENVTKNCLSAVRIVSAAVWSHEGPVTFHRSRGHATQMSSRRGSVAPSESPSAGPDFIEVKALTLDGFAQNHRPPTMVKIDVEGAETQVLRGAERLLTEAKPRVLCEVHDAEAKTFLEEKLKEKGYTLAWLPGHPLYAFPGHVVAWPR